MKFSNKLAFFSNFLTIAWLISIWPANLQAAIPESVTAQQLFATPDEAVTALRAAVEAKDKAALRKIFGPDIDGLLTGDKVQDANNAQRFATAMSEGCNQVKDGETAITLEIGTNNWPMPIPLLQTNGEWYFDTAAGKEEIINRHIGKDELHAIGVCRAYVIAQRQFASEDTTNYAQHFKSSPGKKDGLYWPAMTNEPNSVFGSVVAKAGVESFGGKSAGLQPFHGYYFRILTRQGEAAPGGKMNYLRHGDLIGGFALIAYPEHWDQSGIMTFIVNQDGKVFQQNLGEETFRLAKKMKEYDPDTHWTLVQEDGVSKAVSEE